jgi:hypothetical protein
MNENNRSHLRRISREQLIKKSLTDVQKNRVLQNRDSSMSGIPEIKTPTMDLSLYNKDVIDYYAYLQRIVDEKIEFKLPFSVPFSDLHKVEDLNSFAQRKKDEIFKTYTQKIRITNPYKEKKIYTVIPFRNRYKHLQSTLKTLISSKNKNNIDVGIIVVENSETPIYKEKIGNLFPEVDYIWINSSGHIFNKCVTQNLGAYLTKSEYLHFHDTDLLVPENFYYELLKKLEKFDTVQCFNKRRVNLVKKEATWDFFNSETLDMVKDPKNYTESGKGAPGGSIAIKRNLFDLVGGFDAHFFWGYSIEDAFFWEKIERISKIETLSDPGVEVYHLWHPSCNFLNPNQARERLIFDKVKRIGDISSYMRVCSEISNEFLKYIIEE